MDVEIFRPFKILFKLLKFFGIWMDGSETKLYRIYGYSLIFVGPILFCITLIAGIYKKGFSVDVADPMTFGVAVLVEIIRISDFLSTISLIKSLYELIEKITVKNVSNKNFIKKRMNTWLKIFIMTLTCTIISVVAGFFTTLGSERSLPYPIAVPFDFDKTEIGFWICNFFLFFASGYVGPSYTVTGLLPIFFMAFLIGFMEDFNERIERFGSVETTYKDEEEKEKLVLEELKEIIETYEIIRELVEKITEKFRLTFFVIGVVGSLILCTSVFVIPLVRKKIFHLYHLLLN